MLQMNYETIKDIFKQYMSVFAVFLWTTTVRMFVVYRS